MSHSRAPKEGRTIRIRYCCLLLLLIAGAAGLTSADTGPPLDIGVTGSTADNPRRNPVHLLGSSEAQRLVLDLAERPRSRVEVESSLAGMSFDLDDMIATGLVRDDAGTIYIDFNLLLLEDQRRILEVTESMGRDLAAAFLERREEFLALAAAHDQPADVTPELLFLVLGCFSLDWDGLDLTEQMGWRDAAQRTIDGHAFTPWAKEKGASVSLKGLYWGSHSSDAGAFRVTTFGDHDALPRFGLPDLLWRGGSAFKGMGDGEGRQAAARLLWTYARASLEDTVSVMSALRHADRTTDELLEITGVEAERLPVLLDLLAALDYVVAVEGAWRARIPVLLAEDAHTVDAMVAAGREIMVAWHEANYDRVRDTLSDLTPGRNGVPFERVYTEVWHFAFGIANRTLVEAGLLADPYARRHKGFVPAVWAAELAD